LRGLCHAFKRFNRRFHVGVAHLLYVIEILVHRHLPPSFRPLLCDGRVWVDFVRSLLRRCSTYGAAESNIKKNFAA
jgi:hypothetical protein